MTRIEFLADACDFQSLDTLLWKLDHELPCRRNHGENLAIYLQCRRAKALLAALTNADILLAHQRFNNGCELRLQLRLGIQHFCLRGGRLTFDVASMEGLGHNRVALTFT